MTDDNWITFSGIALLLCVLAIAIGYSSGAFAQTVIAQCDEAGRCVTTREIIEALLGYIQQLEMQITRKCT